ncbi:ATP-binding protein [Streptomyces sp. DSM 116496]|uniref:ATP-binding protein n=1 Tax=Streptomyces stoeckheimensis TaxID=3344656 RepID=UPI0038B2E65C
MSVLEKVSTLLGVGGARSAPPPRYAGIADGLVLTEGEAWAWWTCETSNSDLMSEAERDAEQARAETTLTQVLAGMDVHLRVLWSPYSADDYRDEAAQMYVAGRWQEWAEHRADRLDQIALPIRHVLLGVRLGARKTPAARRVTDAAGASAQGVPARELATWHTAARRLGRRLEASPWRCSMTTVETLAWMITREQHRGIPAPVAGRSLVTGATLAALTQGRALPYPDHLRMADATGEIVAWVAVLTMPTWAERMATPGPGEWLRTLAEVLYLPPDEEDQDRDPEAAGLLVPVSPEASVRLRVLPKRVAIARTDATAKLVREQKHSAANHAIGDPGQVITDAGQTMADLRADLEREELSLVEDHPRLVVTSTTSLEDLRARVDAVTAHYGDYGITVQIGTDEQRALWLETWAGDRVRVPGLGHVRDTSAMAGAWWWGGARVGSDTGPVIGYLTGSTPGVVRLSPVADGRDATTVALIGRSGRGKTTAAMMMALEAAFYGAWVLALDFKGDLGGLTVAADRYALPSRLVQMTRAHAGAADLIPLLAEAGRDAARAEVPAQLSLVTPPHLRAAGAEVALQAAANAVISGSPSPATWQVLQHLRDASDPVARATGDALFELSQTPHGSLFMGRPERGAAPALTTQSGVWAVQLPGLALPGAGDARESWTSVQSLSVAVMHSILAYGVTTAGRPDLRTLPKTIMVPEVHVLTGTGQGRHFLDYIARVGRALGVRFILDTQDATGLLLLPGVIEQLAMVIGFQLTSAPQQDALAELLGLPVGPATRERIRKLAIGDGDGIRHGHSIIRDPKFGAAATQWDVPTAELLDDLDTSPRTAAEAAPDGVPA